MEAWAQTFKDTTIRSAFQKSGVWPINHNLFTNTDYAPSINTSSTAHDVPNSYPIRADDEAAFLALCQENEALATHATLAFDHVQRLKHRLSAKALGSKRRKL
ncbi:hypothetical protein AX14_011016 [Amanita brunnescens Koide BX004]|nr:hypothetical protein AX14_011016 [Amanita brunnescens Koide BX004]